MTPPEILARFDAELRMNPPPEPGVLHQHVGGVVRTVGLYHCIFFTNLDPADADAAIAEQAAFFRAQGAELEWKVYGHDHPTDLGQRLSNAGFEPDEPETLAAFDLTRALPAPALAESVEIRRVTNAPGLEDFLAVSASAFGSDQKDLKQALAPRLKDPRLCLYVAYARGVAVSAARMELPLGRTFATLWGGGTVPSHRGRGLYRALVATRASDARHLGYRFLTVEARETSRPILERLGFVALTGVTGWKCTWSSFRETLQGAGDV